MIVFVCKVCTSYALHLLLFGSCYAVHIKRIVNNIIVKAYIERNNMQVGLIKFCKKKSPIFNETDVFKLGKSLQHRPVR